MELPTDLEAAIRSAPDDRNGYLVAGDWLQQNGDPHGELIALALASDGRYDLQVDQLETALDPVHRRETWRHVSCDWRWGFVRRAELASAFAADEADQLRTLLDAAVARFLKELVIKRIASDELLRTLLALVAARPARFDCLRSLVLCADDGADLERRPFAPLWDALPRLERLVLRCPHAAAPHAFPALRELVLEGKAVDVATILDTAWPALETLRLFIAEPADVLLARFDRTRFPALRRLAIAVTRGTRVRSREWLACGRDLALERLELASERERRFLIDERTGHGARGIVAMAGRGTTAGTVTQIDESRSFAIGRAADCDLVLHAPLISERHAVLEPGHDGWTLVDRGGPVGTVLNGLRSTHVPLRSGDELELAGEVLRFVEGAAFDREVAVLRARYGIAPESG